MNKSGPIVIIEDDIDDQEIMAAIFDELYIENDLKFFSNGLDALEYLHQPEVQPFLVLSDINMPVMNGFELRARVQSFPDLHLKCIPYLFFTTGTSAVAVHKAYQLSAQGIFTKPPKYDQWKKVMAHILNYWQECVAPNRYPNYDLG